jgi:hypothetical protein
MLNPLQSFEVGVFEPGIGPRNVHVAITIDVTHGHAGMHASSNDPFFPMAGADLPQCDTSGDCFCPTW